MRKFNPEIEVVRFEVEDILTQSLTLSGPATMEKLQEALASGYSFATEQPAVVMPGGGSFPFVGLGQKGNSTIVYSTGGCFLLPPEISESYGYSILEDEDWYHVFQGPSSTNMITGLEIPMYIVRKCTCGSPYDHLNLGSTN